MSKVTEAWHYIAILGKACAYLGGEVRLESGLGAKDFGQPSCFIQAWRPQHRCQPSLYYCLQGCLQPGQPDQQPWSLPLLCLLFLHHCEFSVASGPSVSLDRCHPGFLCGK